MAANSSASRVHVHDCMFVLPSCRLLLRGMLRRNPLLFVPCRQAETTYPLQAWIGVKRWMPDPARAFGNTARSSELNVGTPLPITGIGWLLLCL